MGPCELTDLIGQDVNFSVTQSVYKSFYEPRYRPSLIQKELVDAGAWGRKSKQAFIPITKKSVRDISTSSCDCQASRCPYSAKRNLVSATRF